MANREQRSNREKKKPKQPKPAAVETLIIVNGGWTGAGGGKGTKSAFPRMELQVLVDRALRHIAKAQLGVKNLYSCRIDEYRTSKQDGKLRSLLSGRRTAVVTMKKKDDLAPIYDSANAGSAVAAKLQAGVVVTVKRCNDGWCRVAGNGFDGWIEQQRLWGVYADEKVE